MAVNGMMFAPPGGFQFWGGAGRVRTGVPYRAQVNAGAPRLGSPPAAANPRVNGVNGQWVDQTPGPGINTLLLRRQWEPYGGAVPSTGRYGMEGGSLGALPNNGAPVYGAATPRMGNGNPWDRNQGLGSVTQDQLMGLMPRVAGADYGRSLFGPGDWNRGGGVSPEAMAIVEQMARRPLSGAIPNHLGAPPPPQPAGNAYSDYLRQNLGAPPPPRPVSYLGRDRGVPQPPG